MVINATRFGDIEYTEEDLICFAEGLIGFPNAKSFVVLTHKPGTPFRWLQCVEEPSLAFLVAIPEYFVPDYAPVVGDNTARTMGLTEETNKLLFATVSIPAGQPHDMTLNLAGPIVVNVDTRQAQQVVLEDDAYTIKHRVFEQANWVSDRMAA
jgi:flagellar assembly factor FliW